MDARADQFSLAAIAYEVLTGKKPFAGDGTLNVLYKVMLEQPPPFASFGISVAPEVEAVVLRGMSKSADARFGSVLEFSDALKAAGSARAGEERGIGRGGSGRALRAGRRRRCRRWALRLPGVRWRCQERWRQHRGEPEGRGPPRRRGRFGCPGTPRPRFGGARASSR